MDRSLPEDYQIPLPDIDVEHISRVTNGGASIIYQGVRCRGQVIEKVALKVILAARFAPIQAVSGGERDTLREGRHGESQPAPELSSITRKIHLHWREIQLWAELRHPHIHPVYGLYWELADVPAIVSPWSDYGDAMQYLKLMRKTVDDISIVKLDVIKDIARGVTYLHTHSPPIVHGDLKGANILVSNEGLARISDFGYSSVLRSNLPVDYDPVRDQSKTHTGGTDSTQQYARGTIRWMAPELFMDDSPKNTVQTDIWSFGCVMLEIWSDMHPFHDKDNDVQVILALSKKETPQFAGQANAPFARVVQGCLTVDAAARSPVQKALLELHYVPPGNSPQERASSITKSAALTSSPTLSIPHGVRLQMKTYSSQAGVSQNPVTTFTVVVKRSKSGVTGFDEHTGEEFKLQILQPHLFANELDNYAGLRHSHIMSIIASTSIGHYPIVATQYMFPYSLWDRVPQKEHILHLAHLAEALDFIHHSTNCVYGESLEDSIKILVTTENTKPQLHLDQLQPIQPQTLDAEAVLNSTWGTLFRPPEAKYAHATVSQDMFYFGLLIAQAFFCFSGGGSELAIKRGAKDGTPKMPRRTLIQYAQHIISPMANLPGDDLTGAISTSYC